MRALLGTDSYFTEDSQYSPNRHVRKLFRGLQRIFSAQVHLKALIVFHCSKVPRVKVTISVHIAIKGRSDVDNVAQPQALIFLLMGPCLDLPVRLLIRACIDEKEVLSEEVRMLRAFGGKFKGLRLSLIHI